MALYASASPSSPTLQLAALGDGRQTHSPPVSRLYRRAAVIPVQNTFLMPACANMAEKSLAFGFLSMSRPHQ